MAVAGCQVLADGQHVDVMRTHVAHDLQDFLIGLAQADHDAALGRNLGVQGLELLEQVQRELVVRARTRFLVKARDGLEVVVHHVRRRGLEDLERAVIAATEIRHEDFDLRQRRKLADVLDALHEVARSSIAQVVAVHAGDHHVLEAQLRNRLGQVQRLVHVERIGAAMAHVAERAAARALVAHDHEGGRALAEAFANVGARGFFADGVQLVLAQDVLDLVEAGGGAARLHADP
ncbi:hypothetical protein SDC9_112347 [bioreactor metagenome]|uniref:Uncharacterized protein n=1 Tax=bioreactor metagenome TaxID=1076179 RepID=A0A645BLN7_9ZZZZ